MTITGIDVPVSSGADAAAGGSGIRVAKTDEVAPGQRVGFWSELISSFHFDMEFTLPRGERFRGKVLRRRTSGYQLLGWSSDEQWARRSPRQVRADADEDYRLLMLGSGDLFFRHGDDDARIRPGTGALLTARAPLEFAQRSPGHGLVLTFPGREITSRLDGAAELGASLDFTTGLGRVIREMSTGLFAEVNGLTSREFDAVFDRLVDLVCLLIIGDDRPTAEGHLAEIEAAVRRHVRANAGDPALNGTAIAHALGWSLRQVQVALQRAGTTPRDLIREERLRLARARLSSPAHRNATIAEVAHHSGFSSLSAFNSAFRAQYGVRPRELRGAARRAVG